MVWDVGLTFEAHGIRQCQTEPFFLGFLGAFVGGWPGRRPPTGSDIPGESIKMDYTPKYENRQTLCNADIRMILMKSIQKTESIKIDCRHK